MSDILNILAISFWCAVFALLFVLLLLQKKWELKQRREVAERLGLEHHEQLAPAAQAMFAKFALSSRGNSQSASNVLVADSGELRMVIFDFLYRVGSGRGARVYKQTVVMAQSDLLSIPAFKISNEALLQKFGYHENTLEVKGDQFIFHQSRDGIFETHFLSSFEELNGLLKRAVSLYAVLRSNLFIAHGRTLLAQRQFDDALQSFDQAIHFSPALGVAYAWRAYVWSAKGDKEKMLHDFDKAILLRPEDFGVWSMRARVLATSPNSEHRDGNQAVKDGMKACELTDWQDCNCLENLAAAYAETDDFKNAVKWQKKAIAIAPPAWRADFESRLKLYREGKPYREQPQATPDAVQSED
jgi:tetratricopeptide (TPR) repeat protein